MKEEFLSLIRSPCRQTYLNARTVLLQSEQFDPYSDEINDIVDVMEDKQWDRAAKMISEASCNLLLSPRAHLLMAKVCEEQGDNERRQFEGMTAAAICEGILATGEGSQASPYLISRTMDEYDVLAFLEKELQSQSLVHEDRHIYDKITCTDGTELWFDITELYARANKFSSDN
ncbi:DUF4919 domain-containing protein [Stieleria sp. JC731]|uniref:DUF4919 domain-containing protein n=1 Tax=Pirellulaceae TaxID=2691357 RepID=UPI001E526897|nr:DUF4919 domain-containing protein [Stieleria sp. JC731]MCC9604023.1 DUF4919 domain-containing protein [Stieleria sp. JC731]